jgi:hypothetical protein
MCALGLCTLLELAPLRPDVAQISQRLLPSCCIIFENLEKVYQGTSIFCCFLKKKLNSFLFFIARAKDESGSEFDEYESDGNGNFINC